MKKTSFLLLLTFFVTTLHAQRHAFTLDDTLRGSITPERAWWDLTFYNLNVKVEPEKKYLSGKVTIQYTVLEPKEVLQIDLQPPLTITRVEQKGKKLAFTKKGKNAYFITLHAKQKKGNTNSLDVYYEGTPVEATNPPWEGG